MTRLLRSRDRSNIISAKRSANSHGCFRPRFEPLEQRNLLSAVNWTINQASSHFTFSLANDTIDGLPTQIVNQTSTGTGSGTSWTTNNDAQLTGTLSTDYVDGQSIQLLSSPGSVQVVASHDVFPDQAGFTPDGPGSTSGTFSGTNGGHAVQDYGGFVNCPALAVILSNHSPSVGPFSVNNLTMDMTSDSVTPIDITSGTFPATSTSGAVSSGSSGLNITNAALISAFGISSPGTLASLITAGPAIANTSPSTATVINLGGSNRQLTLPVKIPLTFVTNLGTLHSTITGTIVATATLEGPPPTVSLSPGVLAQPEGDANTTPYVFTVTLSAASAQTVTVQYDTGDGTATLADNDYQTASAVLTFDPGVTQQFITVLVNGDTKNEADETFSLALSAPANATLGAPSSATGTIQNDDPLPSISISPTAPNQAEGNAGTTAYVFTVSLSAISGQTVTVHVDSADGSATTADNDYQSLSTVLTFAPGETQQLVTVLVNGDTAVEPNETFTVNLSSPDNATAGGPATGTIVNDDATVAATKLFYAASAWDVTNGATFSDDNAIATDKTAYTANSVSATFNSVSSYTKGINGIMVDLSGAHGTLSASDFIFKAGNNNAVSLLATTTAAQTVTTRLTKGVGGSDRVELIWSSLAVTKSKWLEVIVKGNDTLGSNDTNTGLAASYVFFFGSAPGDTGTGDGSGPYVVDGTDGVYVLAHPASGKSPANISNIADFTRDKAVDSTDGGVVLANGTGSKNGLIFLKVTTGGPFAPDASAADSTTSADVTSDSNAVASALAAPISGVGNSTVGQLSATVAPGVSITWGLTASSENSVDFERLWSSAAADLGLEGLDVYDVIVDELATLERNTL